MDNVMRNVQIYTDGALFRKSWTRRLGRDTKL